MSPPPLPASTASVANETVTYQNVRVAVTPEAPRHYEVKVRKRNDDVVFHDVESVVINTAEVVLDSPIWFVEVGLDVGVPLDDHGDTAWIWA